MKVLFASVEVAPFAWSGGLGEVAGTLPRALRALGTDVRVVMPKFRSVSEGAAEFHRVVDFCPVHMPWWVTGCAVDETRLPDSDVPVYLVEHHQYFEREGIYGPNGGSYPDNLERFAFFCRAIVESLQGLGWQPDVIHLNDWHVALLALYQKSWGLPFRTVYTAHQLSKDYHGIFPAEPLSLALAGIDLGRPEAGRFVREGVIDLARAGLLLADMANTVSPGYAQEVAQPGSEEDVWDIVAEREDRFCAIINGIDYARWDPQHDAALAAHYSAEDLSGKATCKAALQTGAGLPEDAKAPLVGMVSRLDRIKGWELVCAALPRFPDVQFTFLGSGDHGLAAAVQAAAAAHPTTRAFVPQRDERLARMIYAGSDILLVPSLREPCGLAQMIALAYGSLPVVHNTGGLADTITEAPPNQNGFVFDEHSPDSLAAALHRALAKYRDGPAWAALVQRAMTCDFSWDRSAQQYLAMYERAVALG